MQSIQQQVIETLQTLSPTEQQEVLDFAEFLKSRQSQQQSLSQEQEQPMSVLEAAGDLIGSLQGGPPDLSYNPKYMEGFGQE
jgi:hypothetical protein